MWLEPCRGSLGFVPCPLWAPSTQGSQEETVAGEVGILAGPSSDHQKVAPTCTQQVAPPALITPLSVPV